MNQIHNWQLPDSLEELNQAFLSLKVSVNFDELFKYCSCQLVKVNCGT